MEAAKFSEQSSLPQEMMSEILIRLPVKSILKFRCVCKSWLSLISSSQFIKTHLNFSSKFNYPPTYSLILASYTFPRKIFTCSISSILTNPASIDPLIIDLPLQDPIFVVVGTCNGLLCVYGRDMLMLCNPITKKLKILPVEKDFDLKTTRVAYGFCYDELNDDYKVVLLSMLNKHNSDDFEHETWVKVYSLRDHYWRQIEGFQGWVDSDIAGICVGGVLHWSASSDFSDDCFIVSLDIVTYLYGFVELPEYDETDDDDVHWTLGEFGGCLGVICDYSGLRVDVWVMKEYGVKESWIKLLSIPYPVNPMSVMLPFFESGNGEVILNYDPYVMLYNSRNSSLREP